MFNSDQVRRDQINEGQRRVTLSTNGQAKKPGFGGPKKPFVAKGHDAILKGVQDCGGKVEIITIGGGETYIGKLIARDKFTITIEFDGRRKTFYKHGIESFEPILTVQ